VKAVSKVVALLLDSHLRIFELLGLVGDDLLHDLDDFLLLVKAVSKVVTLLLDLLVSTVGGVLVFAHHTELFFQKSNLLSLLRKDHLFELFDSVAEFGVLVVRRLVFTGSLDLSGLNGDDLLQNLSRHLLLHKFGLEFTAVLL